MINSSNEGYYHFVKGGLVSNSQDGFSERKQ